MTIMDFTTTLNALRKLCVETGSLACLGCGYEHNCSTHGCAILRNAIEHMKAAGHRRLDHRAGSGAVHGHGRIGGSYGDS